MSELACISNSFPFFFVLISHFRISFSLDVSMTERRNRTYEAMGISHLIRESIDFISFLGGFGWEGTIWAACMREWLVGIVMIVWDREFITLLLLHFSV